MIDERFTVLGVWIVVMVITFMFVGLLAFVLGHDDFVMSYENSFIVTLVIFVVLLELILSSIYVIFKNNPEEFGYTRIEQEVETEVTDE